MYETRQHKDKKSRQIEKNMNYIRGNSSLSTIQAVWKQFNSYEDARINWIKSCQINEVIVEEKFKNDHMLPNVNEETAKQQLKKRQNSNKSIYASTLIDEKEEVSNLIKSSVNNNANARAGVYPKGGNQQLRVKFLPAKGSLTAYVDSKDIKTKSSNSVVVAGNWEPENKRVHVYHYEGDDFKNKGDEMKPMYMWYEGTTPKIKID